MKNGKQTILVVDDTKTNIDIIIELLGSEYDIVVSLEGESALSAVHENDVDLILLDIMMPKMNGFEVCGILKEDIRTKDIPILFLSAKTDEESIEKAYEIGGIDYITKPFRARELLARVKTQIRVKELIEYLAFISSHDEMTGIYNRRKFFELGKKKFEQDSENLYAVMIDIDKFKHINDTYGHPTGDKVIKVAAKTIAKHLPKEAIFGRLGGEEFGVVCIHSSSENVKKHIETIREAVENLELSTDNGDIIKFTISEGVAKAAKDMKSLDELLKKADDAMYEAKGKGRNRVIFR